jgi:hypothetical protein
MIIDLRPVVAASSLAPTSIIVAPAAGSDLFAALARQIFRCRARMNIVVGPVLDRPLAK